MVQVNIRHGYFRIDTTNADEYTLRAERDDGASVDMYMRYEEVAKLRAMLWDAIRRQGRGFEFSVDDILRIEEVQHKGRYSVEGYKEEINWTIDLLQRHLTRIDSWQDSLNLTPAEDRKVYGKLDEFLAQLEEPTQHTATDEEPLKHAEEYDEEDTPILQCQICGATLDISGLDQSQKYVCEDCRARNPQRLSDLQTAALA